MNFYLKKYGFRSPSILTNPNDELNLIVVIPCFNEPDIISTLKSLNACDLPQGIAEIFIIINAGIHHDEKIKSQNLKTLEAINQWQSQNTLRFDFYPILIDDLPKKHAGVGLARKIGMDEAVARFHDLNKDGIIICFDADSLCEPNYFVEIENHFSKNPKTPGCAIRYEHPIAGEDFNQNVYDGIINYELFLRYYNQGLHYANLPFAFHTVGSSMAIRSSAYQKQGGMNKRKAGEDFYFLHKIIALGNFTELNSTKVIPSPRTSDRVPFGTGKAINDWIESESAEYLTYDFKIWKILKAFVETIPNLENIDLEHLEFSKSENHQPFIQFLNDNNFQDGLNEIRENSTNHSAFVKRFFVWFNAFRVLKLVHYLRDQQYPNQTIFKEAQNMAKIRGFYNNETTHTGLLLAYRTKEQTY